MHEIFELIKGFDLHTILPLGVLIWILNRNLKHDIDKRIEEIKNDTAFSLKEIRRDNAESLKEIHREFKFINIRLSRVEGTTYGKDIYKQE
jgi:hypothetical protein